MALFRWHSGAVLHISWNPMLARPESCFNEPLLPNVGKVKQKPQWVCRSQSKSGMTIADINLTILPHQNRFFADTQRTALHIALSSSHIKFSIANGLCPTITGQLFQGLLGTLQFGGERHARSHLNSLISDVIPVHSNGNHCCLMYYYRCYIFSRSSP